MPAAVAQLLRCLCLLLCAIWLFAGSSSQPPATPAGPACLYVPQAGKTTIYIPVSLSDVFAGTWTMDSAGEEGCGGPC